MTDEKVLSVVIGGISAAGTIAGVIVAVVIWLVPFQPVGPSPILPSRTDSANSSPERVAASEPTKTTEGLSVPSAGPVVSNSNGSTSSAADESTEEDTPGEYEEFDAITEIRSVRIDSGRSRVGYPGLLIHVDCSLAYVPAGDCFVLASFSRRTSSGTLTLRDTNGRYRDRAGNVSVSTVIRPEGDVTYFDDITMYIPAEEIETPPNQLEFIVQILIVCGGEVYASSEEFVYRHNVMTTP